MADDDILQLLFGEDPGALAAAQAKSRALRKDQLIGEALALTGHRNLPQLGGAMIRNAQAGQDDLRQLPGLRLSLAQNQEALSRSQADRRFREATEATMRDPASSRSVLTRALAAKYGKSVPGLQISPTATAAETEPLLDNLQRAYAIDENAAARRDAANASRIARNDALAARSDLKDQEREDKLGLGPDFVLDRPIGETPRNKAFDAISSANVLVDNLADVSEMLKKGGPAAFGASGQELRTTFVNALIQLKEKHNLGALAGPDLGLLMKQVPDPAAFTSFLQSKLGVRDFQTAIDTLMRRTRKDVVERARSLGARPRAEGKYADFLKADTKAPGGATAVAPAAHPDAKAAIEWAKNNPNDDRAKEILKRFGGGS